MLWLRRHRAETDWATPRDRRRSARRWYTIDYFVRLFDFPSEVAGRTQILSTFGAIAVGLVLNMADQHPHTTVLPPDLGGQRHSRQQQKRTQEFSGCLV